jgi:uncharacterized membrane-anchored protein
MRKFFFLLLFFPLITVAQTEEDSLALWISQVESSLDYQTGNIQLEGANASINVPEGFGYLNLEDSRFVLEELWGNPADSAVLGMLVPKDAGVLSDDSWAYIINFEELGYVSDEDADKIDYNELLVELKKETELESQSRITSGFESIVLVGWASSPYYDKDKKTLHWAKEYRFGGAEQSTLNYNLRILGRKGVIMMNAVAAMPQLDDVKKSASNVINSVTFNDGHRYSDFNPDIDEVAAWTVGGLVAGKVLAKVGLFAGLLKFWKVIAIGLAAAGTAIWRFFKRDKEATE